MSRNLIDRDAFVEEMHERVDSAIQWGVNAIADGNTEIKIRAEQAVATFCEASLTAKKMPTVDAVEVVHGEWYRPKEWSAKTYRRLCTNCQDVSYFCGNGNYNYCPNCGAKMDGEVKNDE